MAKYITTERAADFDDMARVRAAGRNLPFTPMTLEHVYIKLEFKPQFENARNAEDARGFLRSVARASLAAHQAAQAHGGVLTEVQGSTLHVAIRMESDAAGSNRTPRALDFAADLHWALRTLFNHDNSRVDGWRMTVDAGKTLVVSGRGVHGDDSWVSLGKSANRPAKHLYAQLELAEDRRDLKRFHVGIRDAGTTRWRHTNPDSLPPNKDAVKAIGEHARQTDPLMHYSAFTGGTIKADAAPLGTPGSPASPSADQPRTYFGWVMRTDLDGFTARVAECIDDDAKLQELAIAFYGIMDAAAEFVSRHEETLAQLPWAGDNFTAAAVFATKDQYDEAISRGLVELTLDFEKDMADLASESGFGGWAYAVAGGEVHGNSGGNVYIAGIEIEGRRFLVGAGEGFGRSTQGFGDVNPKSSEHVVYQSDFERLDELYKDEFGHATNTRGQQSTLFQLAKTASLVRARTRTVTVSTVTPVTFAAGQTRAVQTRPYSR